MKKFTRIQAMTVCVAMLLSICTVFNISAAAQTTVGKDFENFNDWEVGVLAENTENTVKNYTVGSFQFNLQPGDKIEIAEENSNRFLKMTKGTNGGDMSVIYNFKSRTENAVRVSYKMLAKHHSKYPNGWGLIRNAKGEAVKNIIAYGNDAYIGAFPSGPYVGQWLSSNVFPDFIKVEQTMDFNTKTYGFLCYGKNSDGALKTPANTSISNTAASDVSSISWGIKKHNIDGWGGSAAKTDDNPENNGIYYIDDIKIEDLIKLNDTVKISKENFDNYPEGVVISGSGMENIGNVSVGTQNGDSASIATDPVTNSKALKLVKGSAADAMSASFSPGIVTGKKVKISYDVRFENHSKLLRRFGSLNSTESKFVNFAYYQGNIWWTQVGGGYIGSGIALNQTPYSHVEYTFDPNKSENNLTYKFINGSNNAVTQGEKTVSAANFQSLSFEIESAASDNYLSAYVDHMGRQQGDGVYWLDNLSLEVLAMKIDSSNISNEDQNVSIATVPKIRFTFPVSLDAVDYVSLWKNGSIMDVSEYTVVIDPTDANTVIVTPAKPFDYETSYAIMFENIKSSEEGVGVYEGGSIFFSTSKYSEYLKYEDYSSQDFVVGTVYNEVGKTYNVGNFVFKIEGAGDSVEVAIDPVTSKKALKITKGNESSVVGIKYMFKDASGKQLALDSGKIIVGADSRIEHHSKGHNRWPTLVDSQGKETARGIVYSDGSYWLNNIGNPTTNFIGGVGTDRKILRATAVPGESIYFQTVNPATGATDSILKAGLENTDISGISFSMANSNNNTISSYLGSATATVENANNYGIAWIGDISVTQTALKVVQTSFENGSVSVDTKTPISVTFNESVSQNALTYENFEVYKANTKLDSTAYALSLQGDGKTVKIDITEGLAFETSYKIVLKAGIASQTANILPLLVSKELGFATSQYDDSINPDIVWTSVPNGKTNLDASTKRILLRSDAFISPSSITNENIVVKKNNTEISKSEYNVSNIGYYTIAVDFVNNLAFDSAYSIGVSGLVSGGTAALPMTKTFEETFTTAGVVYLAAQKTGVDYTAQNVTVKGRMKNDSSEPKAYQLIGVLKTADGKVCGVQTGATGTIGTNELQEISIAIPKNENAKTVDVYAWDSISSMKPVMSATVSEAYSGRTYGYDNYIDSQKPLNVSFIGGSITQQGRYTTPLMETLRGMLQKGNSSRKINFNVQGVGGTGTSLGLYRLEKDVIVTNPDIVFIEFAVNDAGDAGRKQTMEGMIRKLMELPHQPVVILLNVTTKGYGSEASIADWADLVSAYGIGTVDVCSYLKQKVTAGDYVWQQADLTDERPDAIVLTGDGTHPNDAGGKEYADYMYKVLSENQSDYFKKLTMVENPVSQKEYYDAKMIPWSEAVYDNNWRFSYTDRWAFEKGQPSALSGGATLTFTFTGTTIGLYMPKFNGGSSASYSIDNGAYTGTISNKVGSLTARMPMPAMIKTDLANTEHTITITVNPFEAGTEDFTFGYFIVD